MRSAWTQLTKIFDLKNGRGGRLIFFFVYGPSELKIEGGKRKRCLLQFWGFAALNFVKAFGGADSLSKGQGKIFSKKKLFTKGIRPKGPYKKKK